MDAIEKLLGAGIAVQVEHGVGMPVPYEELPDAERPLAMRRADDHDVADVAVDQFHAPQDERAHEDRAQLAVGLDQCQQVVASEFDDLAVGARPDLGEPAPA